MAQREFRDWTSDCQISVASNVSCKGVATVVEVVFDDQFTAWFGPIKLGSASNLFKVTPGDRDA
jgi:hypothetical protein